MTRLDALAGIDEVRPAAKLLARTTFIFVVLMAFSIPFSIAAANITGGIALAAFTASLFVSKAARRPLHPVEIALVALFLWSAVTAFTSYDRALSLDQLKGPLLFLIVMIVNRTIRNARAAWFITATLLVSTTIVALIAPVYRIIGRGIEIHGVAPDGALGAAGLIENDQLMRIGSTRIYDPADIVAACQRTGGVLKVPFHRPDYYGTANVDCSLVADTGTPAERLGFTSWRVPHYWRSSGFYSHYTTFAEVLMLVGALVFGILAAAFLQKRQLPPQVPRVLSSRLLIAFVFGAVMLALFLTVTRGSEMAMLAAAFVMILVIGSRKAIISMTVVTIIAGAFGLYLLQRSRDVGMIDTSDGSTQYRLMMWRDGFRIWTASPRNFIFGVGMDSIKSHWFEWGMFDKGWQQMGHFHSLPMQLVAERGLPALLIWIAVVAAFLLAMQRAIRNADPPDRGILLGCFGAMAGFVVSGLVHNNLGDAEVAIVLYIIIGIGIGLVRTIALKDHAQASGS